MSKKTLALICAALFLLGCAGGLAYLRFSPTGALNPRSPDRAMEDMMSPAASSVWLDAVRSGWTPQVSQFEDAAAVRDAALDALSGGPLSFCRADGFSRDNLVYTVYSGDRVLCVCRRAGDGVEIVSGPELEVRRLTFAVPAGASLTINGVEADPAECVPGGAAYGSLTELESRYTQAPALDVYSAQLYGDAEVAASRGGRALEVEEAPDTADFCFTDDCSVTVLAPVGAKVTINGAEAAPTGKGSPAGSLTAPAGYEIPEFDEYAYTGLRDAPEAVSASLDGVALTSAESGGVTLFLPESDAALEEEHAVRVETLLKNALYYGAGLNTAAVVCQFILPDTELYSYYLLSPSAMFWVRNETISIDELETGGFVPLGDDCFLCRADVRCSTKTYYEDRTLDMTYSLLYVRDGDGSWLAADMDCTVTATEKLR